MNERTPHPTPRGFEARSSGPRWNSIVDRMVARFWEREQYYEELLTMGGFPPFQTPLQPREQYDRLVAWRAAGDQRFWGDKSAQAALDELSLQFGTPPPLAPLQSQAPPRII